MNTLGIWLAATRPAFLSITLLAVLLGFSHAVWQNPTALALPPLTALLTLLGALLAHAGANVLNDVADADNGSDAANTDRVAPYTGGSRMIQHGTLSRSVMHRFGWGLLATSALCGVALLILTDLRLLAFGLGGLVLAFAYSLPPLQLMARGLGEVAVVLAWLLIIVGSDFVLRRQLDPAAWLAGLPLALQTGLILLINQIPDRAADAQAGKRNWTVRLDANQSAQPYLAVFFASYATLLVAWACHALPTWALLGLLVMPLGLRAAIEIPKTLSQPARLVAPIQLTLLQAHLLGALLAGGLLIDLFLRKSP